WGRLPGRRGVVDARVEGPGLPALCPELHAAVPSGPGLGPGAFVRYRAGAPPGDPGGQQPQGTGGARPALKARHAELAAARRSDPVRPGRTDRGSVRDGPEHARQHGAHHLAPEVAGVSGPDPAPAARAVTRSGAPAEPSGGALGRAPDLSGHRRPVARW